MKEKFEELAKGEPVAAVVEAVLVGEVMVSDSSSSWTLAMLDERPELKPPKGPEPPGKVDSAIMEGRGSRGNVQSLVMEGCKWKLDRWYHSKTKMEIVDLCCRVAVLRKSGR